MRLAKDGRREIGMVTLVCGAGVAASVLLYWPAAVVFGGLWVFGLAFFRDPERQVPDAADVMVSPADGKVTEVSRIENHPAIGGPARRIGIFLSIFNVHINRSPCDATVIESRHEPGKFMTAMRAASSSENESNTLTLETCSPRLGRVLVRQVAGVAARRIVCHSKAGDELVRGQRFGMIKFGSRTELIVPDRDGVEVAVSVGDRVRGGETILVRVGEAAAE